MQSTYSMPCRLGRLIAGNYYIFVLFNDQIALNYNLHKINNLLLPFNLIMFLFCFFVFFVGGVLCSLRNPATRQKFKDPRYYTEW